MSLRKLKQIARKARTDYYFLCKEILGFKDLEVRPHRELCWMIESGMKRKKLILMPRGSFKSSVVNIGYAIRCMIKNPNVRILISSETQRNSIKYVQEIRSHLDSNEKFRAIFGDWYSPGNTWRDNEFTINTRTIPKKEPTVMASSLEKQTVVGMHYDVIILDDVVSKNNINTPDQVQKTLDHYRLLLSVLDPGQDKQMIIVGTRWSWVDLYGWVLEPTNGERSTFDIFQRQAIDPEGNLLLPKRLTHEFLDEQRRTQGEFIFNCQYQNKPVSGETATFNEKNIKFYEKAPENMYTFISVDPAISTKNHADYSAIVVIGVDSQDSWYILEAKQMHVEPSDLMDQIFEMVIKYNPMCVAMERFALEKVLKSALSQEMNKRKIYFGLKDVPTDTRVSKEVRIRGLQPRFEQGKIYLHRSQRDLYHQLVHHPQLKNDDLVDALKTFLQVAYPPDPLDMDKQAREKRYAKLSMREEKIWRDVDKVAKRRVRQKQWSI